MPTMTLPKGRITSGFGYRTHPVTKQKQFHNGIDIALPIGTPVLAPLDGYVMRILENTAGGLQLKISCGDYEFGFAHLSKVLKDGGSITEGETIALSGNSGRTTGPHLHFTVRYKGELIDPQKLYNNGK